MKKAIKDKSGSKKLKFCKLTEKEYEKFWEHFEQRNFLSAPEISKLHERAKVFFLGVKDKNEKIQAAIMVRGTKNRIGKYFYYAPRGPLLDFGNFALLSFFVKNLKVFLKQEDGILLRIDPYVRLIERDIDGEIVKNGYDNHEYMDSLIKLGFKKPKYNKDVSQIIWQFVLPLEGKTEDELLSSMKSNTRRRLKQALDLGIYVKDLKYEELNEFYEIESETAQRRGFPLRGIEYFQKMYKLFEPKQEICYVSAVINPAKSFDKLSHDLEEIKGNQPATKLERRHQSDAIRSIECRIERLKSMFDGKLPDKELTLSSGMFFTIKPEILHLAGGNDSKYMKLDGQYVLQWEMIKRALNGGYSRYNFYGIPVNVNLHPDGYGVYEFKRGFSGVVEELVGEYDLPLSPLYILMHH